MEVVRARLSTALPELIGDGGGLPFPLAALGQPATEPLDPADPAVVALLGQIDRSRKQRAKGGLFRRAEPVQELDAETALRGWRVLARADEELLFGRGAPPQLVTAAVTKGRGDRWTLLGVSVAKPLRAVQDGVRASSWRLDPDFSVHPDDTELHVLLTEQTMASGRLADDRILPPELALDGERLVLRCYVRPLEGYTGRSRRHETQVLVQLPEPVGEREPVDGAVFWAPPVDATTKKGH